MIWLRLKNLRVVISVTILIGLTLALLGGTYSLLAKVGSWLAAIQFVPSLLALSAGSLFSLAGILILIVTLLAGRVYCSTICPLGALQDVITRLRSLFGKKQKPLLYATPVLRIRAVVLVLVVLGEISGWTSVVLIAGPLQQLRSHRLRIVPTAPSSGISYRSWTGENSNNSKPTSGGCALGWLWRITCSSRRSRRDHLDGVQAWPALLQYDLPGRSVAWHSVEARRLSPATG